jgi:hypothetical protein
MDTKGFSVVSFERVQKSINSSYDTNYLNHLIKENSHIFKQVKNKNGKIAIKKI